MKYKEIEILNSRLAKEAGVRFPACDNCTRKGVECPSSVHQVEPAAFCNSYRPAEVKAETTEVTNPSNLIPVSYKDYMLLSDAYDEHSRGLMGLKGKEYAIDGDFLAMENRLAGMLGDTPEYVSLVMAGKHITALGIILLKNDPDKIKLEKLDERVRDATNLLKIMAAFIHAKQNDFSLHLGADEEEKVDRTKPVPGGY